MVARIARLLAALLLIMPASLPAQDPPLIEPGNRIRVTAPTISADLLVGTLTRTHADTCVMEIEGHGETLSVPLASMAKLEVSRGLKSYMTWGALVGVSVGGAIGWALSDPGTDVQITNVVLFAGLGSLVGTFAGSYIKHENWETVPLGRLPVVLTSDSSDGIALSITIGP